MIKITLQPKKLSNLNRLFTLVNNKIDTATQQNNQIVINNTDTFIEGFLSIKTKYYNVLSVEITNSNKLTSYLKALKTTYTNEKKAYEFKIEDTILKQLKNLLKNTKLTTLQYKLLNECITIVSNK